MKDTKKDTGYVQEIKVLRKQLAQSQAKAASLENSVKILGKYKKDAEKQAKAKDRIIQKQKKKIDRYERFLALTKENVTLRRMMVWARKSEKFTDSELLQIQKDLTDQVLAIKQGDPGNLDAVDQKPDSTAGTNTPSSSDALLLAHSRNIDKLLPIEQGKKPWGRQPNTKTCGRDMTVFDKLDTEESVESVVDDCLSANEDGSFTLLIDGEKQDLKYMKTIEHKRIDFVRPHFKTRVTKVVVYTDTKGHVYTSHKGNPCAYDFVPKGKVTNRTVAALIADKVVFGIPLNRQVAKLNIAAGDTIVNTQLITRKYLEAGEFLQTFAQQLKRYISSQKTAHADESYLTLVHHPKKKGAANAYLWSLSYSGKNPPAAYFEFDPTRGYSAAENLLGGCSDMAIQTDAYSLYKTFIGNMNAKIAEEIAASDGIEASDEFQSTCAYYTKKGLVWVACFSHGRRKIEKVFEALYKQKPESVEYTICNTILGLIRKVYEIEKEERARYRSKKQDEAQFLKNRKDKTLPVLTALRRYLTEQLPNCRYNLEIGVKYLLKIFNDLIPYLDYSELTPDNSFQERQFIRFAQTRRESLFCSTVRGGKAWATLYSICQTAILNTIDPTTYLKFLLDELAMVQDKQEKDIDWESYFPWNQNYDNLLKLWKR